MKYYEQCSSKSNFKIRAKCTVCSFGSKDSYTIRWDSKDITQPSQSELDASIVEVEKLDYQLKRLKEYPDIGDQLDDLYAKGAFSDEMAAKIKAVKDKYPKE